MRELSKGHKGVRGSHGYVVPRMSKYVLAGAHENATRFGLEIHKALQDFMDLEGLFMGFPELA